MTRVETKPSQVASSAIPQTQQVVPHPVIDHTPLLRQRVQALGWTSPETAWRGWHEVYRFVCAHGHERRLRLAALSGNPVCQECRQQVLLGKLREMAAQHGGECLNDVYLGQHAQHRFR